ncbi:class I adenylate-forming enzyme family protein [Gracilibacillus lacisalsi]|uniref:class I adenylate-forming enzyme family protein n=1 Tax=Gracilibacillus lacisalsi TaxID=393087 RepID=UPI00036A9525|nr:class I adenylate-forming enzyme family protein [Gracilibacillus lacisalsi]
MTSLMNFILNEKYADNISISTFKNDYTNKDLLQLSNEYINLLKDYGDLKGKRVAILSPHPLSYFALIFAINSAGGTVVPLNPLYKESDLTAVLTSAKPHLIFTVKELIGVSFLNIINNWIEDNSVKCTVFESEDCFNWDAKDWTGKPTQLDEFKQHFMLFTSGSTGMPKGVMLSQEALFKNIEVISGMLNRQEGSSVVSIPPQTVGFGMVSILSGMRYGFRVGVPDMFDFPKIVDFMHRISANKLVTTPSILRGMYKLTQHLQPEVFQNIKECFLAGEMVSEGEHDLYPLMSDTDFIGIYGITEGGGIMTCNVREGLEWQVVNEIDYKIEDGEFVIKSLTVFSGYYNRPDLTKEVLTEDRWLLTGDLVRETADGKLVIIGRKKDMIKKGGQQVIPYEIEECLLEHSAVRQVAVVGSNHEVYGEEIVAFVVLQEEIDGNGLYQHCTNKLARFKVPDHIKIIDDLPVVSGKADKTTLRKLLQGESE